MAGIPRPAPVAPTRKHSMRPPQSRAQSVAPPSRSGAVSPAESVASIATTAAPNGIKRKERDYEQDAAEETNINVVVRCRGRNEREVRENSGVVLSTDGVKGKTVELSMGPTALSNKTYHFDKVFSPAADQSMIYDDVVTPILDEVGTSLVLQHSITDSAPDAFRLQLYHFRLWPDWYGQNIYNVR
jgi:kinesin family member 11